MAHKKNSDMGKVGEQFCCGAVSVTVPKKGKFNQDDERKLQLHATTKKRNRSSTSSEHDDKASNFDSDHTAERQGKKSHIVHAPSDRKVNCTGVDHSSTNASTSPSRTASSDSFDTITDETCSLSPPAMFLHLSAARTSDSRVGEDSVASFTADDNRSVTPQSSRDRFPCRLYKMVERCHQTHPDVCCWTEEGDGFVVWDSLRMAQEMIPLFFNHSNYTSFIRQLNNYGFSRRCEVGIPCAAIREQASLGPSINHVQEHDPHFEREGPSASPVSGSCNKQPSAFHHNDGLFQRGQLAFPERIRRRKAAADAEGAVAEGVMQRIEKNVMDYIGAEIAKVEENMLSFTKATLVRLDRLEELLLAKYGTSSLPPLSSVQDSETNLSLQCQTSYAKPPNKA